MILETLVLGAIAGGIGGLIGAAFGAAAAISLEAIRSWLRSRAMASHADLIRTSLANGQVNVVAIGLNPSGFQVAGNSWTAKSLDQDLRSAFGFSGRVRITV